MLARYIAGVDARSLRLKMPDYCPACEWHLFADEFPDYKDLKLTQRQWKCFCSYGCSVECGRFLKEYFDELNKRKARQTNVS